MWDMREDFKHPTGILFCEFYDSFFALFDVLVKSRKKFEYLNILCTAADVVLSDPMLSWLSKHKNGGK